MSTYDNINEIYHVASLASPPFYKKYPLETLDVGYIGTKNVLELCKHYNCKLLYSSTSEVYGDALEHPQRETYYGNVNTVGFRSAYDESKRVAETLVYTYTELYDLNTRIIRIFNTYGPHMMIGDGRIVTEIIRCMLLGKPLTIYGDGEQTRSLNYVSDTIGMMVKVMESTYKSPINIGSDKEITMNHLVEVAKSVYKKLFKKESNLKVEYAQIDKDDPKVRRPDLTLNKEILGESNKVSLETGLAATLMYFKEIIDNH